MINTIIVDDEAPARQRISRLLYTAEGFEIVAECQNGLEALARIRELKPSLLFLDVQMPGMDGFAVLQELAPQDRPVGIIFVTAHDHYAVRAFDLSAVDYLLKPYSVDRFYESLRRVCTRIRAGLNQDLHIDQLVQALAERKPKAERLVLRSREGVQFVEVDEIDWLQGDGNYTVLHLGQHQLRIRESISDLDERLGARGFLRIHRSIIVNTDRIFRIEPWGSGEYVIFLRNGTKIQSSRKYSDKLQQLFR